MSEATPGILKKYSVMKTPVTRKASELVTLTTETGRNLATASCFCDRDKEYTSQFLQHSQHAIGVVYDADNTLILAALGFATAYPTWTS